MQVGDKVILSAIGMERYMDEPDNPRYTLGVIDSHYCRYDDFDFDVTWSNGESNIYMRDDLQVIKC